MRLDVGGSANLPVLKNHRIVEIDDHLLMDSIDCTLDNFKPFPMNNVNVPHLQGGISVYQTVNVNNPTRVEATWRNNTIEATELVDNKDPNIVYKGFTTSFSAYGTGTTDMFFGEFRKEPDGRLVLVSNIYGKDCSYNCRICDQDDDYVYFTWQRQYNDSSSNGMNYIGMYSKKTKTHVLNSHTGRAQTHYICQDRSHVYFFGEYTNNCVMIYALLKSDASISTLFTLDKTDAGTSAWMRQTPAIRKVSNSKYEIYCVLESNSATRNVGLSEQFVMWRIIFDLPSKTTTGIEVLFENLDRVIPLKMKALSTWTRYHHLRFLKIDGLDCLVVTVTDDKTQTSEDLSNSRICLFDITGVVSAKLLTVTPLNDLYDATLFLDNNKTIVGITYDGIDVYMLDHSDLKYKVIQHIIPGPTYIQWAGVDKLRRIWHSRMDLSAHVDEILNPMKIVASYENEVKVINTDKSSTSSPLGGDGFYLVEDGVHTYVDTKITPQIDGKTYSTYLTNTLRVHIQDFDKKKYAKQVRIRLSSNQVFASNGKHDMVVTTSKDSYIELPVKISALGTLTYNIEII